MKRSIEDYEAPGFDAQQLTPELTSVTTNLGARKAVEVEVREDGRVLWVNVDGVCVLRCYIPLPIEVVVTAPRSVWFNGRAWEQAIAQRSPPDTD